MAAEPREETGTMRFAAPHHMPVQSLDALFFLERFEFPLEFYARLPMANLSHRAKVANQGFRTFRQVRDAGEMCVLLRCQGG
jgi:hypothetical protein